MSAGPRAPSACDQGSSAMRGVIAVLFMLGAYYVIQWLTRVSPFTRMSILRRPCAAAAGSSRSTIIYGSSRSRCS